MSEVLCWEWWVCSVVYTLPAAATYRWESLVIGVITRTTRPRREVITMGWSEPMGGCDADGNPLTVSFGYDKHEGQTLLGDGDRSESNFFDHANHDHYGSGNGPHNNGTNRGQYTGNGS